ncbi:LUD domain-containing protein [Pontibacter sp. G13]|uniref:LutC/YkgG family protein n=1 Tax=Pontibacter sp. G13 TaxID=3074898 RepID=UPI00288B1B51|nr:LUD domain-containing protein [Pontibacter sp. G13]WNJ19023.1 LUD domain-containing protein [Pontibacter sp. G13]
MKNLDKSRILSAIDRAGMPKVPLPKIPVFDPPASPLEQFEASIASAKGNTIRCQIWEFPQLVKDWIANSCSSGAFVLSGIDSLTGYADFKDLPETAQQLAHLDIAVLEGKFGVAENGAIWLPESVMGHRSVPFICQHLILVIPTSTIAPNMHEAYKRISLKDCGYGVFIGGPSKTADIEQSLVVGAHGPRSLTVFLLE